MDSLSASRSWDAPVNIIVHNQDEFGAGIDHRATIVVLGIASNSFESGSHTVKVSLALSHSVGIAS